MKFSSTLLYSVLAIPKAEYKDNCFYVKVLKTPLLILMLVIGVPTAIIIDAIGVTIAVFK